MIKREELSDEFKGFHEFNNKFNNSVMSLIDSYKIEKLYHYTTLDGFKNIIENDSLWMSERNYLNDINEINHSDNLLKDLPMMFDRIHKRDCYIFSSSMEEDKSNQWAHYGGVDGICIEFNKEGLDLFFNNNQETIVGLSAGAVVYEDKLKKEMAKEYKKLLGDNLNEVGIMTNIFFYEFINSIFKENNSSFEKEFRYCYYPTIFKNRPKYRTSNGILIPYLELNREIKNRRLKLPITTIIIGPKNNDPLVLQSIKRFLEDFGYNDIIVKKSMSSYRR